MTSTSRPTLESQAAANLELATFYVGELLLGIPIHQVEEISRYGTLTPVPGAPPSVSGVMSLRGEVVTVLDFRMVLGLGKTECTKRTRNVIVHAGSERIGLLVDRVADVVQLSAADLLPPPANLSSAESAVFHSVYRMESELLLLVDIATVTAVAEARSA